MATPTRSQAVSTPKSHLPNTPGRPLASPRPVTSNTAQKTLAYKSPAVKTPASAHGHGHNLSVSSQPSSTPLGATAAHDSLMNLDSPATALLNSMAPTGLTPLNSGQDGLGIATHPRETTGRDEQPVRSPEAERLHRLHQVVAILRSKMVGRGITREGVERIARVHGFEALWDDDNLTIAGNIVELDIVFDSISKDRVADLVLKLNSADGESHLQEAATQVLRAEVGIDISSTPDAPMDDLQDFSTNLQYLAQMDRISTSPSAFEAVGSLYRTFQEIWLEEKKRMKWRNDIHHLCKGSIGRPSLDRKPRLGITLDYWKDRREDPTSGSDSKDSLVSERPSGLTQARFSCGEGGPSISSSLKWVSPQLLEVKQSDNVLDLTENLQQPAWLDHPTGLEDTEQSMQGGLGIGETATGDLKTINAHFLCSLDPEVLVPSNTALRLSGELSMVAFDQGKAILYPDALQSTRNAISANPTPDTVESRWSRQLFSRNGERKTHSYALYAAPQGAEPWFYPLSQVNFGHPRHLASILPVARQYVVLWALLRNLVLDPTPTGSSNTPTISPDKRRVSKRSNATATKLHQQNGTQVHLPPQTKGTLSVDISLDVLSDPNACTLEIFAPLLTVATSKKGGSFVHFAVMVKLNGVIEVSEMSGISDSDTSDLRNKLGRILTLTEDIGMAIEWLIERAVKSEDQT